MFRWLLLVWILFLSYGIGFAQLPHAKSDTPIIYVFHPDIQGNLAISESEGKAFREMLAAELARTRKWKLPHYAPAIRFARKDNDYLSDERQRPREIGKLLRPLGVDYFVLPRVTTRLNWSHEYRHSDVTVRLEIYSALTGFHVCRARGWKGTTKYGNPNELITRQ